MPKKYFCDGGAFIRNPGKYQVFHSAYFSVIDEQNNIVKVELNLGDMWSGLAEYHAIKWAVENIKERPIVISSDCETALAWARRGSKTKKHKHLAPRLDLEGVTLLYEENNLGQGKLF